jgi:hypothetical protein
MPQVVKGVADARRVLKKVDPELYKQMNARITGALKGIRDLARSEVPETIFGLRNFTDNGQQRVSRTNRARAFPSYDGGLVRTGLTYSIGKKKATNNGFSALYSMLNKNPAGAIVETAGRLNPYGDPNSQSNNPNAGNHFINAITGTFGALEQTGKSDKTKGRLMGAAVVARKAAVTHEILKSIQDAIDTLQREVDAK